MNTAFSFDPRYARLFGIPQELRNLPQWCVADMREGRTYKAPLNPYTGQHAKVDDPTTWGTFADAVAAAQPYGWPVGIVFSRNDPYCVIDLDNKPSNPASERDLALHRALMEQFSTYTERSLSGSGAHIIARGAVPKGANFGHVEMYSDARFAVCTGDVINAAPVADCSENVARWYGLLAGARETVEGHVHVSAPETHTDAELFQRMTTGTRAARNYALLTQPHAQLVSEGFIAGYDTSPSVSVGKLIMELCYLTQNDTQVKRMLAQSVIGRAWHADDPRDQDRRINISIGTARAKYEASRREELADNALAQLSAAERAPYEAAARSIELLIATGGRAPLTAVQADEKFHIMLRDELLAQPPLTWLVHNVMPAEGVAALYGASGSGKTFLAIDMAIAIAAGDRQWFGHDIDNAAQVTYLALEGSRGLAKRVDAWERHSQRRVADRLGFIDCAFDMLTSTRDVDALSLVMQNKGRTGGLTIIDTLARSAPGADENSSQDMGMLIANATRLQQAVGGVVLLVHHTGKTEGKGLRGHSSLYAALDAAIEVVKTVKEDENGDIESKQHSWNVAKSKDGEDGKRFVFELHGLLLGHDTHGRPVTSCVVKHDIHTAATRTDKKEKAKSGKIPRKEWEGAEQPHGDEKTNAYRRVVELLTSDTADVHRNRDHPCVSYTVLRKALLAEFAEATNPSAVWSRALNGLKADGWIKQFGGDRVEDQYYIAIRIKHPDGLHGMALNSA